MRQFPAVGVAVMDTAGRWCAMFPGSVPLMRPRDPVTIVFAEPGPAAAWHAEAERLRDAECPAAFAQSRWMDYRAYDLKLVDSLTSGVDVPLATLAVASVAHWIRGTDGRVRADLDADGVPEEANVCRAHEGHHFTLWSDSGSKRRRRAHEYYDLGALVDPTCTAGESGEQPDSSGGGH